MLFSFFKKDKIKSVQLKEKEKVSKKLTKLSNNISKETEIYIKNNLAKFLFVIIALYNYDNTLKIGYLPILLLKKLVTNISTITDSLEAL